MRLLLTFLKGSKRGSLTLLFLMLFTSAFAARVEGVVTDVAGEPVVGVTVMVGDTNNGTLTDINGKYSIDVKEGTTLIFSYMGMQTVEVKVTSSSTAIDVVLKEDASMLEDVVVVGYGTSTKISLTSAITSVGSDELMKTPTTNISQGLSAMLPGLQSVQSSGQPGADSATITLRGSNYGVTYIVDGVPRSIDDIDPNDVESISLLKDAAATAVYGLNSAGGVIIITTKKGKQGPSTITYRGNYGVSMNTSYPEFLDGPGYAYWYNTALANDGYDPIFSDKHIAMMKNGDDSDGWGNTNWIDETFGVGTISQHSVTSQGGNEKTSYFASIGYMDQNGNINSYGYSRYNVRSNVSTELAHGLKLSLNVAGSVQDNSSPGYSAGGSSASSDIWLSVAQQAAFAHPYIPMKYDGMSTASVNGYGNVINPVAAVEESGVFKSQTFNVQSSANLEWNVPWVKGLTAKLAGSYDRSNTTLENLSTPYYLRLASSPTFTTGNIDYSKTIDARNNKSVTLTEGYSQWSRITSQASLNYNNRFGDHGIEALTLLETRDYKSNYVNATAQDLKIPELPELSGNGATDLAGGAVSGSSAATRSVGLVMRAKYDYLHKYFLEFTGRYDGSYKFAGSVDGSRWGFFPSLSGAWRISEEDFFVGAQDVVDDLKFRASYGTLGSDNVPEYSYLSTFSSQYSYPSVVVNGVGQSGLQTSVVANAYLTWERQESYNIGLDATLWGGLLGVSADAFYNYTYDILSATSGMPDSMGGYYSTYINNDAKDSRGVEVNLSHNNNIGDFKYYVNLSTAYAKTRWLTFQDSADSQLWAKRVGSYPSQVYGMVADGLFQSQEEIDNSPCFSDRIPQVGDIKYVDLNGDGVISYEQDGRLIGNGLTPQLNGSLSLGGSMKGFDFNVLFIGAALCDVSLQGTYSNFADDTTIFTQAFKAGANAPVYLVENSWSVNNPTAEFPRLSTQTVINNNFASTFWLRDGKYIRLKSAQIGYTVPASLTKSIGINKVRVYCEGQNLFTWSGLPEGVDPEWPNVSNGYYPQQMSILGGIELSF